MLSRYIAPAKLKWWILFTMTTSLSMIFIDMTVLPVTLPTLNRELNFSLLSFQWVINIYTLTLTVLAIAGGRLSHMLGLRKSFCFGTIIFAVASALCGLSHLPSEMIVARVFQGIGASIMIPSQQAIMLETFPPHERGKALGLFVSLSSIFLAIGPFIGGTLTQYLNWRYIFWINLPIATFGMILTWLFVPSFKKTRSTFDWLGFFTLGAGVSSVMVGIMQAPIWGWFSPFTLLLLAFGVSMIVFLWRSETRHPHSLLDAALIRKKSFIASSLTIFCEGFLLMITVYWAIFFQEILNYTPSQSGSLSSFSTVPVIFLAPVAGFLVDRFGPRLPVALGFAIIMLSLTLFLSILMHQVLWLLLASLFFFGMTMSLIFTPSYVALMNDVSAKKRSIASGINTTLRQFSSTLGLAVFGTLFYQWYYWKFTQSLEASLPGQQLDPHRFEGLLLQNPVAIRAVNALPEESAVLVEKIIQASIISAFDLINIVAIGVAFIGFCIALGLLKNAPHPSKKHS